MHRITQRIRLAIRRRKRWYKILTARVDRADELVDAIESAERELARLRALRRAIDRVTHPKRKERVADRIEELKAARDQLLERLDDLHTVIGRAKRKLDVERDDVLRLRRRRAAILRDKSGQLSPHFHVAEFHCRDGTPVPDAAIPALKALCENVLEHQRATFGGSVYVNSGYRTRSYNASIGGASNSIHIYDEHAGAVAADHICATGSAGQWFANTAGRADGRGSYATFHHADNRNRIGWPDAVWYG